MLALNSKKRRLEREIRKKCERFQQNEFNKQIERINEELFIESKYNAVLHVLYFMIVLHDEEGIGALRLNRYFEDFAKRNAEFKTKLEDGIAWTYVRKRLSEIGVTISDIDFDKAEELFQKKYEEGVNRTGVSVYKE